MLCSEPALVCLLAVLSACVAAAFLVQFDGPVGPQDSMIATFFGPAVLFATGHGFANAAVIIPELEAFLNQQTGRFSADQLPEEFPLAGLNPTQRMHPYLMYLLGACWRIFGISWTVVQGILIVFFCITVVLAYGLFRLGMNRFLSAAAALLFLLAPTTFTILPALRDFSKAPFILGVILILGRLVKAPPTRRGFLGLSALLGLIIGIGLGFRFDAAACILPVPVVIALCPRPTSEKALWERFLGIALFCAVFLLSAWPIFLLYSETGTPSHDVMMGFDTYCEEQLGLSHASYERLTVKHDALVVAMTKGHAQRVQGYTGVVANRTDTYELAGRNYILDIARTFPGDMLTRGYAAIVWALGYTGTDEPQTADPFINRLYRYRRPFTVPIQRFGPYLAAAVLLLISARSLRRAWLALFLVLYFGSYVNLLFEARHHFHMSFVPLWFAGFLLERLKAEGRRLKADRRQTTADKRQPTAYSRQPTAVRRALVFGASVVLLVVAPLSIARAWQDRSVAKLVEDYRAASLEAIETEPRGLENWVLFQPTGPLSASSFSFYRPPTDPFQWDWPFPADYLVAEIAASPEKRALWLRYEAENGVNDFSFVRRLAPSGPKSEQTLRYFFPVYECPQVEGSWVWQWSAFTGVAMPKEYAKDFRGLYRVTNADALPFWLSICIPGDKAYFRPHQRLARGWFHLAPRAFSEYPRPDAALWNCGSALRAREHQGDPEGAVHAYREALATDPKNRLFHMGLAGSLEALGDWEAAAEACRAAIATVPTFSPPYEKLDALLLNHGGPEGRVAQWRAIAQSLPGVFQPSFFLARAVAATGDLAAAIAAYREAEEHDPNAPAVPVALGGLFSRQGNWTEALRAYRKAETLCPNDANIKAGIAEALLRMNNAPTAIQVYREAIALSPKEAAFYVGLGDALVHDGDAEAAREAYLKALTVYPDYPLAYQGLNRVLEARGDLEAYAAAWRGIVRDHPEDSRAYTYLGMALIQANDIAAAMNAYTRAIALNPRDPAVRTELGHLYLREGEFEEAIRAFREAIECAPDFPPAHVGLVEALLAAGQQSEAREHAAFCREKGMEAPYEYIRATLREGGNGSTRGHSVSR